MIKDKEKHRQYLHNYYLAHKNQAFASAKKWIDKTKRENPEKLKQILKLSQKKYGASPAGRYKAIKQNARVRQRVLTITKDNFIRWFVDIPKICEYCGITEKATIKKGYGVLEIDRKDNDIGYRIDNITLACRLCNSIKGKYLTYNEAKFIGENVIKNKWKNIA